MGVLIAAYNPVEFIIKGGIKVKAATFLSDEDLIRKAATLLIDKLGEVEASRFFSMSQNKREESVKRYRIWQETLDKDTFFNDVFD